MTASAPRFVGLDVHKQSIVVSAVDAQQQVLLPARRVSLAEFESWATSHLLATDAVVLEASTNAWQFYDLLEPLVASVTVAHPFLIKLIAQARVKTDGRDALHLAKLLAANLIPAVWVPPKPVRELRAILAHRRRLIAQRTQARNRLHSMLHRHNLPPPVGDPFTTEQRVWWADLPLSALEHLQVRQDLALLEHLAPLIKEVEETLAHLSTDDPWAKPMALLLQLPGVGLVTALTALAAIGDISRFPSAKKLVGYSGLGSSVSASGQTYRTGGITKQGRRDLRAVLVEAAWITVEHHPLWKARFERLAARTGKKKAIIAIARKLLVVMWNVLTHQEADRYAEVEAVGRKFMKWGELHRTATHRGLSWAQFARHQLTVVGLGADLETLVYKGHRYSLAAVASSSG